MENITSDFTKINQFHYFLLLGFGSMLGWSAFYPKDWFTWILEIFPAILALIALVISYKHFRFTNFSYTLILIHCIILFIGGHYTYAEVPLFTTIKDLLHQSRNNFDKVGHFAQGGIPAIIIREILIRNGVIEQKGWLNFIVCSICLAISASYELLEWIVSLISGNSGDAFLGTQGYIWDTQSDMGFALFGAIISLILFSKIHNKQLTKIVSSY